MPRLAPVVVALTAGAALLGLLLATPCAAQQPAAPSTSATSAQQRATVQADAAKHGRSRILCYTAYDNDYFYLAAVVQKPNIAGADTALFGDPLHDDAVAVFLESEEQPGGDRRTAQSVEMAVSAAGGAQLYRGANAVPLHDFSDFLQNADKQPVPFKFGATHHGQLNQEGGDNTSYTVEMAIPWVEIGGAPKAGQRCRFNVISYSAAPGSSPILSLSPAVKTAEDVQNPSLWTEIVFTDSPVRTVGSAPHALVCARVINVKPLIDGQIGDSEWNTVTAFGFGEAATGGPIAVAPNAVAARVKPTVALAKARPAIVPAAATPPAPASLASHTPQKLSHLLFAVYDYDYQNDPRKSSPLRSVRAADGSSLLTDHPMDGAGPWMTYDRVDWQVRQLTDLRRAGIDVVLPVLRGDLVSRQAYAIRGLQTLAAALRHMAATGQDHPLVALYLDTSTLAGPDGAKLDLARDRELAVLYAAIKDFFLEIPAPFRAAVPLDAKSGGPASACVVVLSSAAPFANVGDAAISYCRARFQADFGSDLLTLGSSDFKGKAALDGYVDDTRGRGFQMADGGWIRAASVGTGYDAQLARTTANSSQGVLPRDDGRTYKSQWQQAIAKRPDWLFIDGWNDFAQGSEIAPTLQTGLEYVDMTRLFSRELNGVAPYQAAFLGNNIPSVVRAGESCDVVVRVQNNGLAVWAPESCALVYKVGRDAAGGSYRTAPIPTVLIAGQAADVPFTFTAPNQPGDYTLTVDMGEIARGRKGVEPNGVFSARPDSRSAPLTVRIHVAGAAESGGGALTDYAVTVISCGLPETLETGGSYVAAVTLRNDGARTWTQGGAGRIVARVWRYISPVNATGEPEAAQPVSMAAAEANLPRDVAPGQQVTVMATITFSEADGAPLPAWSQSDNWVYALRWEYSADDSGSAGGVSAPEPIALTDVDTGAVFTADGTPDELPGDHRVPVKLGIRNAGPETWVRDQVRIGYHWYYLDGTEAVWQDEVTPIAQEVEPGGTVQDMLAWITAPPNDGTYWLVWDVKVGDDWVSSLPSVRANETIVKQVRVVHGHLDLVDLSKAYNLDGVASASNPSDGNFDGTGRTLPAELVPPFATTAAAPSTLWMPANGTGLDSSRRISFQWGSKADKDMNVLQCIGQRVELADSKKADVCKAVHLLAASTKGQTIAAFTLLFADGGQQLTSLPIGKWDAPPANHEEVAFNARYTRLPGDHALGGPVHLFHYIIKVPEKAKLTGVQLPNAPDVKIAAITLEK